MQLSTLRLYTPSATSCFPTPSSKPMAGSTAEQKPQASLDILCPKDVEGWFETLRRALTILWKLGAEWKRRMGGYVCTCGRATEIAPSIFLTLTLIKGDGTSQFRLKFRPSEICALSPAAYLAQGNYCSANFTWDDESAGTASPYKGRASIQLIQPSGSFFERGKSWLCRVDLLLREASSYRSELEHNWGRRRARSRVLVCWKIKALRTEVLPCSKLPCID